MRLRSVAILLWTLLFAAPAGAAPSTHPSNPRIEHTLPNDVVFFTTDPRGLRRFSMPLRSISLTRPMGAASMPRT